MRKLESRLYTPESFSIENPGDRFKIAIRETRTINEDGQLLQVMIREEPTMQAHTRHELIAGVMGGVILGVAFASLVWGWCVHGV